MRWVSLVVAALLLFFGSVGVLLCEGALRAGRLIELGAPPDYLGHTKFEWRDAQIIARDGAVMKGWFLEPLPRTGKCIMVLHGIGDSRLGALGFAPMFLQHGYSVLAPDSRAHGQSGGQIVTYGILEADDALRWADWMRRQKCDEINGFGESPARQSFCKPQD
jgi:pimeloyl-ACP methyl ester carboxylesterase